MLIPGLLLLFSSLAWAEPAVDDSFNRSSFPADFVFGAASAAYQYEGAANEDGRGPSIWDTFSHNYPGRIVDGSNGDTAADFYHRYKEDVYTMKKLGLDAFRFSISWSRVLPRGKLSEGINQEGINFYNKLIDRLLSTGVEPYVTLFHWDVPQALDDEYGGFLSPDIIDDFRDFAEVCFKEFGDRVKHWITLNEPWTFAISGYDLGSMAPGRCSKWVNEACRDGNSSVEPYIVAHHLLLSHAAAVKVYKDNYQVSQQGKLGMALVCDWMVPYSNQTADMEAATRAIDFLLGWFLDPITNGDYPTSMRMLVGERLPKFSPEQTMLLNGSFHFVGLNYYTAYYIANAPPAATTVGPSYYTDSLVTYITTQRDGVPTDPATRWLSSTVYPSGIQSVLVYVKEKYNNPLIYITENGIGEVNNSSTLTIKEAQKDVHRIDYHYRHLFFLGLAIQEGVNVKAYFAWSLLDNYEWSSGYSTRFGIVFVDYHNDLKRHLKESALWFNKFLRI